MWYRSCPIGAVFPYLQDRCPFGGKFFIPVPRSSRVLPTFPVSTTLLEAGSGAIKTNPSPRFPFLAEAARACAMGLKDRFVYCGSNSRLHPNHIEPSTREETVLLMNGYAGHEWGKTWEKLSQPGEIWTDGGLVGPERCVGEEKQKFHF